MKYKTPNTLVGTISVIPIFNMVTGDFVKNSFSIELDPDLRELSPSDKNQLIRLFGYAIDYIKYMAPKTKTKACKSV